MVAALYVLSSGPYSNIPDVEIWDVEKDARKYTGPHPVIAHPPCERWGRYWHGGPSARVRCKKGDDGGCFKSALYMVRRFGGVLEHPAYSSAWGTFNLNPPPRIGGWVWADLHGGFTCCVDQGFYGHLAQKATWLYTVDCLLPMLHWGKSKAKLRLDRCFHSAEERRRYIKTGGCQLLSKRQRQETPTQFRDILLMMVRELASRPHRLRRF